MSIANKNKQNSLSHDRLLYLLNYNSDSGIFTWNVNKGAAKKGDRAGNLQTNNYRQIRIDNILFLEHRLAWFYCFEEWPDNVIDHIDRDSTNNKLDNLREVTQAQNTYNIGISSHNTSGFKGVSYVKSRNKYEAYISINNKKKNLGHYATAEEASLAYLNAVTQERTIK